MQLNFDATQVDPSQSTSVCLPLGDYFFTIVSADVEAVKDKPNEGLLKVGLRIEDGPFKGVVQLDRFNIYNSNPQAQQIAYRELSALCHVTNKLRLATEKDLLGGQAMATIGPQQNNDKYSEIKQYKYTNGALPGANGSAQPQQQQAAQPAPAFGAPAASGPAFPPAPPASQPQPAFGSAPAQPSFGSQPSSAPASNLPPWAK